MSDQKSNSETMHAVAELAKAVPVYQDAVQPLAKEVGSALGTVGKAVNIALAPLRMMVWGYEQIEDYLKTSLAEKLRNVPPEQIATPKPNIAGPAVEALRFSAHEPSLRDLYANLLATAMTAPLADQAHPAFVDIVKQLTPLEAQLLRLFWREPLHASLEVRAYSRNSSEGYRVAIRHVCMATLQLHSERLTAASVSIENLCRLALLTAPGEGLVTSDLEYQKLFDHPILKVLIAEGELKLNRHIKLEKKYLARTELGLSFCNACMDDGAGKVSEQDDMSSLNQQEPERVEIPAGGLQYQVLQPGPGGKPIWDWVRAHP